nr:MAG TPA: hypothetical protein [Caudoviricetes sp.]
MFEVVHLLIFLDKSLIFSRELFYSLNLFERNVPYAPFDDRQRILYGALRISKNRLSCNADLLGYIVQRTSHCPQKLNISLAVLAHGKTFEKLNVNNVIKYILFFPLLSIVC